MGHIYRLILLRRHFSTKYSGRVVIEADNGRSFAVEVDSPSLQTDLRGYTLPRRDLICKVTRILQSPPSTSSDPFLDLSDYLQTLTLTLTPSEASEILKSLNSTTLALQFFRFCPSSIPKFRHNSFTYNRILLILSKSSSPDRFDAVRRIVDEMERSGTRGSISTVNILIGIFGEGEKGVEELERCLGMVKKWELRLNCYTYKCLLQAYLRSNDSNKAFEVYREMRRRGYILDIFAYNMLLDALAKDEKCVSNAHDASTSRLGVHGFKLGPDISRRFCRGHERYNLCRKGSNKSTSKEMILSNPNGVLGVDGFCGIFFDCCRGTRIGTIDITEEIIANEKRIPLGVPRDKILWACWQVDQACKVFEDMKKKHCEPDEYSYTIMIRMTGKIGKPNESLAFFQDMLAKGCAPNIIAYNTTIQALAKGHMVDKIIFLFSKMVENDCRPNEFTYSVLLNVLAAEGQLGKLDEVVEISNKYMNKSIYAYLVRTLSKLGHASEAHRLFCNMWSFHDNGDRDAYLSMLESLCNAGKITEALDLLSKIHEKGISSDTIMYNTLFSALGKLKQVCHIHDLYEKMKQDGPSPDIFTYNILISSFGRAGRVEEAVKIFEDLENSNWNPDIISYNSLINCLGKNGDLDEAHMRFQEMQEKGMNPDVVTYSTLIECFGKTDKVEMACRLFDEMLAEGCCPNIVTYNILLDCLERCGRTAEAVDLYAKLKQQGLTPDSITYAVLERLQSGSRRTIRIRKQSPITGWVVSPLR